MCLHTPTPRLGGRPRRGNCADDEEDLKHDMTFCLPTKLVGRADAVAAWGSNGSVVAGYHNSADGWETGTRVGSDLMALATLAVGGDDTAVVTWYRYRGNRHTVDIGVPVVLRAAVHTG
jgi:hypothetical protein